MTLSLPEKVLVLGSGALKIGEAGEFDYSGSQCLKALEEDGVYAIVVNPNIATLQTDQPKNGKVYFQPLVPEFVSAILDAERPDGILLSFGGQTALNCGIQLADQGALAQTVPGCWGRPSQGSGRPRTARSSSARWPGRRSQRSPAARSTPWRRLSMPPASSGSP